MIARTAGFVLMLATLASPVAWSQDDPENAGDESQWEEGSPGPEQGGEAPAPEEESRGQEEAGEQSPSDSLQEGGGEPSPAEGDFLEPEDAGEPSASEDGASGEESPADSGDAGRPEDDGGAPAEEPEQEVAADAGGPAAEPEAPSGGGDRIPPTEAESTGPGGTPWVNFEECPAFPPATAEILRWETVRVPDMVLCRAIVKDSGAEAFALTVSRESPFKPRRADRAEESTLNGRELQWYRGELPSQPNLLIREALIPIAEDRVVHAALRADDAATLEKYQSYLATLPFPIYVDE